MRTRSAWRWLARLAAVCRWLRRPQTLGQRGEAAAARYLRRLGYTIIATGQRLRQGEIDLVAVDGRTLVFVEVKTRTSTQAGHPADAVDVEKQRRLTRLALAYLRRHDLLDCPTRFDVVAVTWPDEDRPPRIEHFKGAFSAQGSDGLFS
jgi:putative endonuclease